MAPGLADGVAMVVMTEQSRGISMWNKATLRILACTLRVECGVERGYPRMRKQATKQAPMLASGELLARIIRQRHGLSLALASSSLAQAQMSLALLQWTSAMPLLEGDVQQQTLLA